MDIVGQKIINEYGTTLSPHEDLILKCIFEMGGKDIPMPELRIYIKEKYQKDYARTTLITFLSRMIQKGAVRTERRGRVSYVTTNYDRDKYVQTVLADIRDFYFDGDAAKMFEILWNSKTIEEKKPIKKSILDVIKENEEV